MNRYPSLSVIALILTSLCMVACDSPLLNHAQASAVPRETARVADCSVRFARAGYCASIDWQVGPSDGTESSFRLRLVRDASAVAAADFPSDIAVKLWMPAMGHGSSPVTVESIGGGEFQVSRVFFIMPGTWEIRIELRGAAGMRDEAVWTVNIQ